MNLEAGPLTEILLQRLFIVIMLFVILYLMACMGKASTAPLDFVTSNGSQLVLNQAPFYFIGSDSYWLINYPDLVEPFFQKCNVCLTIKARVHPFNSD